MCVQVCVDSRGNLIVFRARDSSIEWLPTSRPTVRFERTSAVGRTKTFSRVNGRTHTDAAKVAITTGARQKRQSAVSR